eukprot:2818141-Pyramimonas_sp.AAC.1
MVKIVGSIARPQSASLVRSVIGAWASASASVSRVWSIYCHIFCWSAACRSCSRRVLATTS